MNTHKTFLVLTLILSYLGLLTLSGCGNSPDGSSSRVERAQFAYVLSNGDDVIHQYRLQDDGSFAPLAIPSIATGLSPASMVMDPTQNYVYVLNQASDTISQFVVRHDGQLEMLAPALATGTYARTLAMSPNGNSVYAINMSDDTISQYAIGVDGQLTLRATFPSSDAPSGMTFSPSGDYAYVANLGDNTISQYSVDQTGALTPLTPSTVRTSGCSTGPIASTRTSSGKPMVYFLSCYSETVDAFAIGTDGTLSAMQTVVTGMMPLSMTITGSNLYVTNGADASISMFSINSDGTLSALARPSVTAGTFPEAMTVDTKARTSYVLDSAEGQILQYNVDASGELSASGALPLTTGAVPTQIILK